jgi:hypothetical protein
MSGKAFGPKFAMQIASEYTVFVRAINHIELGKTVARG